MNVRHEFASTGLPTASRKVSNGWPYASSAKFEGQVTGHECLVKANRELESRGRCGCYSFPRGTRTTASLHRRMTEQTLSIASPAKCELGRIHMNERAPSLGDEAIVVPTTVQAPELFLAV